MIRSVQFPMRVESENDNRPVSLKAAWGVAARTKQQRANVRLLLESTFRRARRVVDQGENEFTVTMVRLSPGVLDDDNLRGAFKAIRDEIAAWIGYDDRDDRIRWQYAQQVCEPRAFATRIEIVDLDDGPDVRKVLGHAPARVSAPAERFSRGRPGARSNEGAPPRATPTAQQRLVFVPCYALLPWEPDGGEPVVSELDLDAAVDPPASLLVRHPETGRPVELLRRQCDAPEVGRIWLYVPPDRWADTAALAVAGGTRR